MYNYSSEKRKIFTENGQRDFLKIRDNVFDLLKRAGAIRMSEAMEPVRGDGWYTMALVDRMVELKEIKEITKTVAVAQNRVFVKVGE